MSALDQRPAAAVNPSAFRVSLEIQGVKCSTFDIYDKFHAYYAGRNLPVPLGLTLEAHANDDIYTIDSMHDFKKVFGYVDVSSATFVIRPWPSFRGTW